ncbi:MAG: hypothetical protein ACRC33_08995, partial [Gemmataceae bacterium]
PDLRQALGALYFVWGKLRRPDPSAQTLFNRAEGLLVALGRPQDAPLLQDLRQARDEAIAPTVPPPETTTP